MTTDRSEPFGGFRFWVIGDHQKYLPGILEHQLVAAPGEADIALIFADAADEARAHFDQPDICLLPLVDFSGHPERFPEALWHDAAPSVHSLEQGVETVAPVVRRLRDLPDPGGLPDQTALIALNWAYSRQREIRACWQPGRPEAVAYPVLRAIAPVRDQLEEMAALGLLQRSRFDLLHYCPGCSGSRLNVREECVACRDSHLEDTKLVHHYRCAYQAPEQEFIQGSELVCPKCRRKLRHYGVDYDKPGTVSICRSCGESNSDPLVGFVCMDCEKHTDGEQMPLRKWHHFNLTPDGVAAARSGSLPRMSLEESVVGQPGGYAWRDFIVLFRFQLAQARRYQRPLAAMTLAVNNIDELARTAGRRDVAQALYLLVEILSRGLRQSDVLAARGHTLYVLLPETEPRYTQLLAQRLEKRAGEIMAVYPQVEITHLHDLERMEQLLAGLIGSEGDAVFD